MNFVSEQRQIEIFKKHFPYINEIKNGDEILKMFFEFENALREVNKKDFEMRKCAMIEDELMNNPETNYTFEDLQMQTRKILK